MITWLLLVSLFWMSIQDGNGQDNGVMHCGPQNLTVRSSSQMIHLTWRDEPSCSAVQDELIYELVVLIADEQVHYAKVPVKPEQIESTHSWNWTSSLALECASVRLRSRYKNHTSPWKQERTFPEMTNSKEPQVFPWDRSLKVGSSFTFCCVLPAGQVFQKMNVKGADMKLTKISNQIFDLTVHLDQASVESCTNVECETNIKTGGACAYVGYPPQDSNLQCETRNLTSVECHWTVGRTSLSKRGRETKYQLLGSPCKDPLKGICSKKERIDVGKRNWTLTAENAFGMVNLSDTADLTKRVHMFAPQGVTVSAVNPRNISLKWEWNVQQYYNLNITCQVNISNVEKNTISEIFGVGLNFAVLNDLIPNWSYNVRVRCGTAQHFWKWSDWSKSVNFHTTGDVPDSLDVWMQMKDNQIIAIWKMLLANQSNGQILDYEVTWAKATEREQQNRTTVVHNTSVALSVDTNEDYIITVTARNINGSSAPSTITVPSLNSDRTRVNTSRIIGSNGSFNLSWSASPVASCGYIVDWRPTLRHCDVEWLKVSPSESDAIVFSENFKDGERYSLSIYACTPGAPVLLDRREGYVHEERIQDGLFKLREGKQQGSDFVVSWDPVSLRKQTAFIQGYVLYYTDNNNKVINVSTDDPAATRLTARGLKNGTYTFTVKAKTAVGECGDTPITATLNSSSDDLISAVVISLVTVFGLLTLITIVCFRHWTCIKEKVYPPIPKPVLTSPDKVTCPLYVEEYHHSEADIVDVAELHCSEGVTVNGYISQDNVPSVFAQTYYNQPQKKSTPPPLTLPTTAIPSQSVLPSSPFRILFPNLSYNLTTQPGDQQSYSGAELQEGSSLEISSGGYQPQGHTEIFTMNQTEEDPESPMSCVSTYILLPKSPSR